MIITVINDKVDIILVLHDPGTKASKSLDTVNEAKNIVGYITAFYFESIPFKIA